MNKSNLLRVLPVVIGAVIGYGYYYFIGCKSGTCAITSNPYISTAYGAFTGLIFAIPTKKKKSVESDKNE
jgi:xanthine/uracil permease